MSHWAKKYIGLPYELEARGPHKVDCWGLVYLVYKQEYGIELPLYPGVSMLKPVEATRTIAKALETEWQPVVAPFEGCVITMSRNKEMHHIGIYLDHQGGLVLHSMKGLATVAEPLRFLSRMRLLRKVEFYRYHLWPTS